MKKKTSFFYILLAIFGAAAFLNTAWAQAPYYDTRLAYDSLPKIQIPETRPRDMSERGYSLLAAASHMMSGSRIWFRGTRQRPNTTFHEIPEFCEAFLDDFIKQKDISYPKPSFTGGIKAPEMQKYRDAVAPRQLDKIIHVKDYQKLAELETKKNEWTDQKWEEEIEHATYYYSDLVEVYEIETRRNQIEVNRIVVHYPNLCTAKAKNVWFHAGSDCFPGSAWALRGSTYQNWPTYYHHKVALGFRDYATSSAVSRKLLITHKFSALILYRDEIYLSGLNMAVSRTAQNSGNAPPKTEWHGTLGISNWYGQNCSYRILVEGVLSMPPHMKGYRK